MQLTERVQGSAYFPFPLELLLSSVPVSEGCACQLLRFGFYKTASSVTIFVCFDLLPESALAEAQEAYQRCLVASALGANDLKVQASIGLAKLEFVVGEK